MNKLYVIGAALLSVLSSQPAFAALQECTITWAPNSEADLAGYRVYWSTVPGGQNKQTPALDVPKTQTIAKCSALNLPSPSTYYFVVAAYDTTGNVSGFSNELSRTIGEIQTVPLAYVTRVQTDADGATVTISGQAAKLYMSGDKIPLQEVPGYVMGSNTHRLDRRWTVGDTYICFTAENLAGVKTEQGCNAVVVGVEPDLIAPLPPVLLKVE